MRFCCFFFAVWLYSGYSARLKLQSNEQRTTQARVSWQDSLIPTSLDLSLTFSLTSTTGARGNLWLLPYELFIFTPLEDLLLQINNSISLVPSYASLMRDKLPAQLAALIAFIPQSNPISSDFQEREGVFHFPP